MTPFDTTRYVHDHKFMGTRCCSPSHGIRCTKIASNEAKIRHRVCNSISLNYWTHVAFHVDSQDSRDKVKANQGSCLPISPQECQATLHQATEGRREVVCHWSLSAEGITLRLGDCVSQRLAPAHFQIQGPPVASNYIPWSIWRSLCLMWQFLWFELWPLCLKLFHFSMF